MYILSAGPDLPRQDERFSPGPVGLKFSFKLSRCYISANGQRACQATEAGPQCLAWLQVQPITFASRSGAWLCAANLSTLLQAARMLQSVFSSREG